MSGIIILEWWRGDIIAAPPDLHLILPVFLHGLQFVQSLQCSVVSLVESPVLDDGDVVAIEFLSRVVESLDGPCEDGGVADIELIAVLLQGFTRLDSLLDA